MALTVQRTKFGPVDIVGIDKTDSLGPNVAWSEPEQGYIGLL